MHLCMHWKYNIDKNIVDSVSETEANVKTRKSLVGDFIYYMNVKTVVQYEAIKML